MSDKLQFVDVLDKLTFVGLGYSGNRFGGLRDKLKFVGHSPRSDFPDDLLRKGDILAEGFQVSSVPVAIGASDFRQRPLAGSADPGKR